jgi:hypothetical protein
LACSKQFNLISVSEQWGVSRIGYRCKKRPKKVGISVLICYSSLIAIKNMVRSNGTLKVGRNCG